MKQSMIKFYTMLAVMLVPFLCSAQDMGRREQPAGGGKRSGMERPAGGGMKGGMKGGGFARTEWLERMQKENPEEFERFRKMREEDPEGFRDEMRERIKSRFQGTMHQRGSKLDAECKELSKKYYAAESEEEKKVAREELKNKVQEAFDSRMEAQKK